MAAAVVVQRAAVAQRNADHRLLRRGGRLRNRLGNLTRLAVAETGPALAVADDDERVEAEALAALHRLRPAVAVDQLFDQLFPASLHTPGTNSEIGWDGKGVVRTCKTLLVGVPYKKKK